MHQIHYTVINTCSVQLGWPYKYK